MFQGVKKIVRNKKREKQEKIQAVTLLIEHAKFRDKELTKILKILSKLEKSEIVMLKEKLITNMITDPILGDKINYKVKTIIETIEMILKKGPTNPYYESINIKNLNSIKETLKDIVKIEQKS
ncbi:MAG TPA: hypothetical protein ENO30_02905 [Thermodesulfobium narugense]|nr:hypothetical protein [Thermodesulfobium narugense]